MTHRTLPLLLSVFAASASGWSCRSEAHPTAEAQPPSGADAADAPSFDAAAAEAGPDGSGTFDASLPWDAGSDAEQWPDCVHPEVKQDCKDGWCRIPAGCFILGSPKSEWGRGKYSEEQVPVTLTHPFLMQQYEVSRAQWIEMQGDVPSFEAKWSEWMKECTDTQCPVVGVTWSMALEFANKMSEKHEPPLKPCYKLTGCWIPDSGILGQGWMCDNVETTAASVYECEGYRLPTEAEWEYAARAGTRTAFYSGDITPYAMGPDTVPCMQPEPKLDEIAWTCLNSGTTLPRGLHPAGLKKANGWGLYDILGNVDEWVSNTFNGLSHGKEPLVNPFPTPSPDETVQSRGCNANAWSPICRAAFHLSSARYGRGPTSGFRLVRSVQ